MAAFLWPRCVVDHQIPGIIAYRAVGLLQEYSLKRRAVPNPFGDKMMQLVIAKLSITSRHWLHALAITGVAVAAICPTSGY